MAQRSEYLQMLIESYKCDDFLQADLDYPLVQEAIKHWLGIIRLPVDEAEQKFNEDYRVLQTFGKIQNLQHACAKEGVAFPLELVLRDYNPGKASAVGAKTELINSKQTSSNSLSNGETVLESVLRKNKAEARVLSKEPSVKFANPPKQVEVRFPVERSEHDLLPRLLQSSWLSMEPYNVVAWWGAQFLVIGVYLAVKLA